ncbi:MAG TPA: hypothetical protein PKA13_08990 [Geminicoccaceae bacterium]|nr:hypothetical protein [Geminicoccaceae bacterium]
MTTTGRREPHRTTAADGSPTVEVPLAHGRGTAVLDAEDFDRLVGMGITDQWWLNSNGHRHSYVRCTIPGDRGHAHSIGRLVIGAGRRQVVRHRNGDLLDLRRANLCLEDGRAGTREQAMAAHRAYATMPPDAAARAVAAYRRNVSQPAGA